MQNTRVYERARVKCFKLGRLLPGAPAAPAAPDCFLFLDVSIAAAQVSAGAHYTSHSIPKPTKDQNETKARAKNNARCPSQSQQHCATPQPPPISRQILPDQTLSRASVFRWHMLKRESAECVQATGSLTGRIQTPKPFQNQKLEVDPKAGGRLPPHPKLDWNDRHFHNRHSEMRPRARRAC